MSHGPKRNGKYIELAHDEQPGFRQYFYIAFAVSTVWLLVIFGANFMHEESHHAGGHADKSAHHEDSKGGH